jgi:hypothetical protein
MNNKIFPGKYPGFCRISINSLISISQSIKFYILKQIVHYTSTNLKIYDFMFETDVSTGNAAVMLVREKKKKGNKNGGGGELNGQEHVLLATHLYLRGSPSQRNSNVRARGKNK